MSTAPGDDLKSSWRLERSRNLGCDYCWRLERAINNLFYKYFGLKIHDIFKNIRIQESFKRDREFYQKTVFFRSELWKFGNHQKWSPVIRTRAGLSSDDDVDRYADSEYCWRLESAEKIDSYFAGDWREWGCWHRSWPGNRFWHRPLFSTLPISDLSLHWFFLNWEPESLFM